MHFHIQDHQQKPEQLQGTRNKTKTNQQKKNVKYIYSLYKNGLFLIFRINITDKMRQKHKRTVTFVGITAQKHEAIKFYS